jgi:hypothetical protein
MTTATPSRHKAHIRYRLADGSLVPGVTTVLNVLAKPALVPWANRLGLDGIDVAKHVDELAQAGTLTHAMVLADLQGHVQLEDGLTDGYTKHEIELAENAFLSYLEWKKGHTLEPLYIETPMVSEASGFGGTPDFVGLLDGKATVLDFKTSKDIYPEHMHQVAAYWGLVDDQSFEGIALINVKQAGVIQVGRTEDEGFGTKFISAPGLHWLIFIEALEIYRLQRALNGSHRWRKREESNGQD